MSNPKNKDGIQSYFEGAGFDSLRVVYSDEACDGFRSAIRRGHSQVVETVVSWLRPVKGMDTQSVLDVGCGTGAVAVPLAIAGARVDAIDFSARMIQAAQERARRAQVPPARLKFAVGDLSSVNASYDAVVCIDVFARYSTEASIGLLKQLASRANSRLIFTFTPKKAMDPLWLAIGGLVAKRRQAPPLYTHSTEAITGGLRTLGWTIHRQAQISAGWKSYFCCLVEARPEGSRAGVGIDGFRFAGEGRREI
jgi:magnesium-protoporphyrin O-methyltransferase